MRTSPNKLAATVARAAADAHGASASGRIAEAGKRVSAQNALEHGLTAAIIVLSTEDARHFHDLRAAYIEFWKPRNIVESDLVDEMLAARWRQRRVRALKSAASELELDRPRPQIDQEFAARLSRRYSLALRTLLEVRAAQPPAAPEHDDEDQ